jgi:hypothetical protein
MGGFVVQKLMERRKLEGAVLMASVPYDGIFGFSCRLLREDPFVFFSGHLSDADVVPPNVGQSYPIRKICPNRSAARAKTWAFCCHG